MSPPETASVSRSSLAQDWLGALRYWLRGRRGVAVVVASAVVLGAALNWSWLVAVGIAPLLLAALPCVAMCGLGLCMNRMTGGSCSTSQGTTEHASAPAPVERDPDTRPSQAGAAPDASIIGSREEHLYVQKDGG